MGGIQPKLQKQILAFLMINFLSPSIRMHLLLSTFKLQLFYCEYLRYFLNINLHLLENYVKEICPYAYMHINNLVYSTLDQLTNPFSAIATHFIPVKTGPAHMLGPWPKLSLHRKRQAKTAKRV